MPGARRAVTAWVDYKERFGAASGRTLQQRLAAEWAQLVALRKAAVSRAAPRRRANKVGNAAGSPATTRGSASPSPRTSARVAAEAGGGGSAGTPNRAEPGSSVPQQEAGEATDPEGVAMSPPSLVAAVGGGRDAASNDSPAADGASSTPQSILRLRNVGGRGGGRGAGSEQRSGRQRLCGVRFAPQLELGQQVGYSHDDNARAPRPQATSQRAAMSASKHRDEEGVGGEAQPIQQVSA
jgi:hypothetical protein